METQQIIRVHPLSQNPTAAWTEIAKHQNIVTLNFTIPTDPVASDKVRFVCMSDTHSQVGNIHFQIPDGDVFIHAGDFTMCGERAEVIDFNNWMGSLPHKYKVVVCGNHELCFDNRRARTANIQPPPPPQPYVLEQFPLYRPVFYDNRYGPGYGYGQSFIYGHGNPINAGYYRQPSIYNYAYTNPRHVNNQQPPSYNFSNVVNNRQTLVYNNGQTNPSQKPIYNSGYTNPSNINNRQALICSNGYTNLSNMQTLPTTSNGYTNFSNTDNKEINIRHTLTNCTYLEDSFCTIYGIKLYGTPWQPEFRGCHAFHLRRGVECLSKWNLIPGDTDILITHTPPLGYGDLAYSGLRAGCVELLSTVQHRVDPKYHVFGHIHEGYGVFSDGRIVYINASTCDNKYVPKNVPIVFDVPLPEGQTKN